MSTAAQHGVRWGSMPLPTYHTIGIYMQLFAPLAGGCAVCLYYPTAPAPPPAPTPANVLDACRATGATGINIVPAFLEASAPHRPGAVWADCVAQAWALDDDHVAYLKTLDILVRPARALGAHTRADRAPAVLRGRAALEEERRPARRGGREPAHNLRRDRVRRAHEHLRHRPLAARAARREDAGRLGVGVVRGQRARALGTAGRRELRVPVPGACVRGCSRARRLQTHELHHPSLENLSDVKGYATHDLFVPHPTKPNLWRLCVWSLCALTSCG